MSKIATQLPKYSRQEVLIHNSKDDCWIAVNNKVYNVTKWLSRHPGGSILIENLAGKDCSDEFEIFHYNPSYKLLNSFLVGHLKEEEHTQPSALKKDVALLHEKLKKEGVFKPDYLFYAQRATIIISLFVTSLIFLLAFSPSMYSCIASAICLGLFWQQLAFVGHDLGHHVVTHDRHLDDRIGIFVGNGLQGISLDWWRHSHNTHHTVTNSVSHDPDIQHLPFLAVSKEFFKSVFSFYHKRVLAFDPVSRFFVSKQYYMFYPIMALARFNLYAQSFIHLLIGPGSLNLTKKRTELLSLLAFWIWFSALMSLTGSWAHAFVFLLCSHATAGIVHIQICISHFSMQTFEGIPQAAFESDGYFRSQLLTTANVDCHPMLDFFHGGLQFQIEHHLFPHLTRSKLRYVQGEVKKLCQKHNLSYINKSFYEANKDVVLQLMETSKQLHLSSMFWDGVNMVG